MNKKENPFSGREKAIAYMGGNTALYEKHLNKFQVKYAVADQEMELLLSSGELEDAEILAHSIKGLAGTLGLTPLYDAAAGLEQTLKQNAGDLTEALLCFKEKLHDAVRPGK